MARKDVILKIREVLARRRDALRTALAGDIGTLRQQPGGDAMDRAVDAVQDELRSQLAEVESRELAEVENALARMREGNYGVCERCGRNIPMARLHAIPYATLCVRCQHESEQERLSRPAHLRWDRLTDMNSNDNDPIFEDVELDVP